MTQVSHTLEMSVDRWIEVKDNPIQRDTERHAAKAKHLLTPLPTHRFVFAGRLPNGDLVKMDGHTRALLWQRGQVPSPATVTVGIVPIASLEEAESLYKTFDSQNALETMRDKVSGAFNRLTFEPQSGLLQHGSLTYALRTAYTILKGYSSTSTGGKNLEELRKTDIYTMINEFSPEIFTLDGFGLRQGSIQSGIVAAFLISTRKYGHKITDFWRAVFADAGTKSAGKMDAVQALNELIMQRRGQAGGQVAFDLCCRALMAVEKWLADELLSAIPRPLDTTGYFDGYTPPTERLIKAADIKRA